MLPTISTVLVVDDDDDIRDTVQGMLEGEGFATIGAWNGAQAILALTHSAVRPGLILSDLMMPVMSGWQLFDALSIHRHWSTIPRLAMTACEGNLNLGTTPFVRKPFQENDLLSAVRKAFAST